MMPKSLYALTTRILPSLNQINGPARLFIPGFNTPTWQSGAGIIGKICATQLIDLRNLYSKSDVYSNRDLELAEVNPALPAFVIAHFGQNSRKPLETEIGSAGEVMGYFNNDEKDPKIFDYAKERKSKYFVVKQEGDACQIYEIDDRGFEKLATLDYNIISFAKNRSREEIDVQNHALKGRCEYFISQKAHAARFKAQEYQHISYSEIHEIIFSVDSETHCKAMEVNAKYRDDHDKFFKEKTDEEVKKVEVPIDKKPNTSLQGVDLDYLSKRSIYNDWNVISNGRD